jgi:hypothetical protein
VIERIPPVLEHTLRKDDYAHARYSENLVFSEASEDFLVIV